MPRWPATKAVLPFSSNGTFAIGNLPACGCEVGRYHLLDELGKWGFRLPTELFARLAGIADQKIDFGWRKYTGSMRTTFLPDFLSTPVSSTPLPRHSMARPFSAFRRTPVRLIRAPRGS